MTWSAPRRVTPAAQARRREYDSAEYRRTRKALGLVVQRGDAWCWRCSKHLPPGCAWHVGHDDYDRRIIRGPECAHCNLSAAAKIGNAAAKAARTSTSLTW